MQKLWVYNVRIKRLMISRDVEFDENTVKNWEEEKIEKKYVRLSGMPPA